MGRVEVVFGGGAVTVIVGSSAIDSPESSAVVVGAYYIFDSNYPPHDYQSVFPTSKF